MTTILPDVLMYHYVRDVSVRPAVGYRAMDPATFETQLDDLARHRTPIGWPALQAALSGGPPIPSDAVLLTFDDGLADHHRSVLPALAARRIPAVFFVLARRPADGLTVGHAIHVLGAALGHAALRAAVIERLDPADRSRYEALEAAMQARRPSDPDDIWKRPFQRELAATVAPILGELVARHLGPEDEVAAALYLADAQLRELRSAGMTIAGHGFDHPWLDHVGGDGVAAELAASARQLAELGETSPAFAYPYGGVPGDAATLLRSAGFAAAFTTDPMERDAPYRIGRYDADELGPEPTRQMREGRA